MPTKTSFPLKKASIFKSLVFAFTAIPLASFAEGPRMTFEENKNQWPRQVKYMADIQGGRIFLEQNTFTYVYKENINLHHNPKYLPTDTFKVHYHSIKVNFENSNPHAEIIGNDLFPGHRNYYIGNDKSKWADNVPLYGQVYYKDLYENIDMRVYNVEKNFKYDIIVHPGGNTKNIKLNYLGADKMHLANGHLFIKTSVYDLMEQKPYAYQEINGVKTQIACSYKLFNNSVTFSIDEEYDRNLPLIIDPTLIVSTYTGSSADNFGFSATYDAGGNIYVGGTALGIGYPTTVGAWDNSFNGGGTAFFDISLTKLNPTGSALIFSTYYGGSADEQPHSLIVNNSNELYVVGRSNSPNFPTTNGTSGTSVAFDQSQNGGFDIIVGKFNSTGGLMSSTVVGGTANDGVNNTNDLWNDYSSALKFNFSDDGRSEIILDANSNVYVASCSRSTDAPLVNAYDNVLSGIQDGYVFKMNSTLSAMTWSTFLGGSDQDASYGLKLDNSLNVYVTGGTASNNFPLTAGYLNPTYGGAVDGFIAVFNSTGTLQRSTYLGTAAYDQSYLIEIDATGDLYVFGQTQGTYPTTTGVYKNSGSGQFIHKVTGNLTSTVFSTVIGTGSTAGIPNVNISPIAFLVDSCQTIYISGWGRCASAGYFHPSPASNTGMPITTVPPYAAYQPTTDGCDFYFAVLAPDAKSLVYATYFGENAPANGQGDHVDGGTSRFDKRGLIYQANCASCTGTNAFPTTPGAWSTNNLAPPGGCNEAVVKMDISVKPIAKANVIGATQGCAPFGVSFNNVGSSASDFIWDFGDGGIDSVPSPTYTYNFPGTYTITLYAIETIGICEYIDTSIVSITVGQSPTLVTTAAHILCNGGVGSANVSATGGISPLTYSWSPSGGTSSAATGLAPNNYTVTVTDATGCTATKTVSITQPTALTGSTSSTGADCGISNGTASATAGGGTPTYTYSWQPSGGASATATGIPSGNYTVILTDANGCTTSQIVNVPTANGPTVTIFSTNTISCNGDNTASALGTLTGGTGPYTYAWTPSSAGTNQSATGLSAGSYTLTITDAMGCSNLSTILITEPSALTLNVTKTDVLCNGGSSGTASASVSGGTSTYTYSWGTSPVQTTSTATGLSIGTYSVLISDGNGCTQTATSALITQPIAMAITTTTSGSSCGPYANGIITASATNGTAPYNYTWSSGQTGPVLSNILGGTYTVTVTDANGCSNSSPATMPTSVLPVADFTNVPTISCEGVFEQFTSTSTSALSWNWNFGGLATSTLENPGFIFPYNGTYVVSLIVGNPPCKDTATKSIVIGDMDQYFTMDEANVFTPNADGQNDCFLPALIGPGADTLKACLSLQVFDRWGVKMFESIGVDNCWNGNNLQDNKPALDGTYYYIAKLGQTNIRGYVTLARHK